MGPGQGHGRARRAAEVEPAFGDVVGVPDLLGDHPAVAGERLHGVQEPDGLVATARGQLEVGALAGQQRPGAADPHLPSNGRAVSLLAVAVAVVAVPGRAARGLDLQEGVDRP